MSQQISSSELTRGREAAEAELAEAKAEHGKCAYAYAMDRNDDQARGALIDAKQRMALLEDEVAGLGAATTEAERIESVQRLEGWLATLERNHAEALRAIDAVPEAFSAFVQVVTDLRRKVAALQDAEQVANLAINRCVDKPHGHTFDAQTFRHHELIEGMLWLAVGDGFDLTRSSAVMSAGGKERPEAVNEIVATATERARAKVAESVKKKRHELDANKQALAA